MGGGHGVVVVEWPWGSNGKIFGEAALVDMVGYIWAMVDTWWSFSPKRPWLRFG